MAKVLFKQFWTNLRNVYKVTKLIVHELALRTVPQRNFENPFEHL